MHSAKGDGVAIGAFVKVALSPWNGYGIGKLTRVQGRQATVSYFDIPDDANPPEVVAPLAAVKVVDLQEQTRVFHLDEGTGRWRVGRVLDGEGPVVMVQFPNGQIDNLPREDLHTRWRRPIADPVAFLSRRVTETPMFAEARSGFVRSVIGQRAASLGMGAILSSNIELVDFQLNVVKQVLQDPVQRYLLADEVGLGKTIEAGILIRQYILDEARTARVLVIVPPSLVNQWRAELASRFNLAEWLDDFVYVVAADRLDQISRLIERAGMLVVDEAHHLSRQDEQCRNHLYDLLRVNAQQSQRLLLLSATPVLSDTAGFLRVLHLLDPVVFPLDDLAGFERRLRSRQLVAEAVAALVPDNVLSMEDDLDRLQDAFQDDETLTRLISTLRPIVQALPGEGDESFLLALSGLRSHLTESYKLHRRILRNRRRSVPGYTPPRSGVDVFEFECAVTGERRRSLDVLRVRLANIEAPVSLNTALLGAAVHPTGAPVLYDLLQKSGVADDQALAFARHADVLTSEMRGDGVRTRALVRAVEQLLRTSGQQVVVFCDQVAEADAAAAGLQRLLAAGTVQRHSVSTLQADDEEDATEPWHAFRRDPSKCRVLVCDRRAEEGLNLHGGKKVAVHYDLPLDPNRIEQRLGRLDRFGAGDPLKSVVLVCRDNQDERTWLTCLDSGLQVFKASIASLQYLIEETLQPTADAWAGEGEPALVAWRDQLVGPSGWVAKERRRIDQQDALDALGEAQGEVFDELEAVDDAWQLWRKAFDDFVVKILQFQKRAEDWKDPLPEGEQVFRLAYRRESNASTLVTLNAFIGGLLGAIDTEAPGSSSKTPLTFAYAYRRNTALSKRGTARKVRALRYGDAIVESLFAFCETDDRGRVHAMWRQASGYEPLGPTGVDLYFRFDFLMEADLPHEEQPQDDALRALRRRVDGHFAPQFYSVWVLPDGQCLDKPPHVLLAPYRSGGAIAAGGGRDYNLNASRWQVLETQTNLPWLAEWSKHCGAASDAARGFVLQLDEVSRRIRSGLSSLRNQYESRVAQLNSRAARLEGPARDAELIDLRAENDLHRRLATVVASPSLRLDSAGAIFVAPTSPFAQ
jgi:ATP-dependent helicase HepA